MNRYSQTKEEIAFCELEQIIESNNLAAFEKKLKETNLDLQTKDQFNNSFLHIAGMKGSLSVIEFLIDKGLEINAINSTGKTPLHLAIKNENIDIAIFLIKKGANYSIRDKSGRSVLDSATRDKRIILQKYLR